METTMANDTRETETSTVTIVRVHTRTALHEHYSGQTEPQGCYVWLDCESRRMGAEANPEIGNAVPMRVWHGHVRRYPIATLTADAANALLDEIAPLAERVCDGYSSRWNGSNHVAEFDEDAEDAEAEIERLCESLGDDENDCVQEWDAADWLGGIGGRDRQRDEFGITAATTDEELSAIEDRIETEARDEGVDALHGLRRYLRDLRDEVRE